MRFTGIGALVVGLGVLWVSLAQAQQVGFTQEDRARIDRRFEQMQNSMNTRFVELMQFLQIITGIFTVIMVAAIGFAFWDRRTVLAKSKEVALEALAKDEEIRKIALVEQVTDEVLRRMDVRKATPLQAPPSPATA